MSDPRVVMTSPQPFPAASGAPSQIRRLFIEHFDELHRLAARQMSQEQAGQTLQTTALVNELAGQMLDPAKKIHIKDSNHFLATAALAMHHILIDRGRHKQTLKAGGARARNELPLHQASPSCQPLEALVLQEQLQRLEAADPEAAHIVKMRCQGYSIEEAASQLNLSRSSTYALWSFARAWLIKELEGSESAGA